ncbi:signal peptidase complex catalytic subunit SEC11A isoform 2 [Mus musculus]|uniref:signal peptidase complex catalytic subunit SEC11A isoform 2 n=1 Tax=Mus musculus TaxID=10090 RepID=UPI0023E32A29|nr:signal peptidase complex catalytic subunit SEC11A isoform 2 [Mus musculus]
MLSLDFLDDVRRMNKRQLYYQVLNFGMIVSSALMIWKGLMVITGSESPIVVVLRFVPYIGIVTILMNDYPKFKYAVLFLLGLFVLVHRE